MIVDLANQLLQLEREAQQSIHVSPARYLEVAERMIALGSDAAPDGQARALRVYGNALRTQGRLHEARTALTQALRLWRKANDEIEWARTQTAMVAVLAELGRATEALRASRLGLEVFLRHDQRLPAARLLNNTGGIYLFTGRPREALSCYARAGELAAAAGDRPLLSHIELHRAGALQKLGRPAQALTCCATAFRYAVKSGEKLHMARIQEAAAISLFHLGRFGKALRRFAVARTLFEAELAARDVGECDLHICACYIELNRLEQALTRAQAVLDQPDRARAWYEVAYAWFYNGVALARLGRRREAQVSLLRARRLFAQHGDRYWTGQAYLEEAEILLALGAPAKATRLAARAKRHFAEAGSELAAARALLVVAEGNLRAGRLLRAWAEASAACRVFRKARTPGPIFHSLHLLGRIALRRKEFAAARKLLSEAIRRAEQMRATVQVAFRQDFLDDKAAAYADLVWINLQEGRVNAAHRLADRAKSRGLIDLLTAMPGKQGMSGRPEDQRLLAEIEAARREYQQLTLPAQLGGTELVGARSSQEIATARQGWLERKLAALWDEWELRQLSGVAGFVQQPAASGDGMPTGQIEQGMVLVEYVLAHEQIVAFVSDARGLRGWVGLGALEPVRMDLELLQLNLDAAVAARGLGDGWMTGLTRNAVLLLQEAYRRLWAPLRHWLAGKKQVVIIPHGPLHLIPFAALHDGTEYLVEQIEISLAPSRKVWLECRRRAGLSYAGRPDVVMGFNADGILPFVEEEARWVASALGTDGFLGNDARLTRLSDAGPYRVVHLAVHGQFRQDNPNFSTLLLSDGALTTADAAALRISAALVVLSGCETGMSRVTTGEEITGMITAFLAAGCATVLASYWRVDDQATASMMQQTYSGLLAGRGKAAALREAQSTLAQMDVHPLYWAAFSVIGDGGPLLTTRTRSEHG